MNNDLIGNLTTICKIIIMTVAPYIAIQLGTDDGTVIAFLTAVLTFILAIYDAKYPNTMKVFGNKPVASSDALNDEYLHDDEVFEDAD